MYRLLPFAFLIGIAVVLAPSWEFRTFDDPIDALSIGVEDHTIDLAVSAKVDGRWTAWEELELETEFDPLIRESNMVMFPKPVTAVRIIGSTPNYELHPIRVSKEPAKIELAARRSSLTSGKPRILTRRQWGANESFLVKGSSNVRSDSPSRKAETNGSAETPQRVKDCEEAQRLHPGDFRASETVTTNNRREQLRWPRRYSPAVKLLVVHHTAQEVNGDGRPGIERMRALYDYHANSRGWGDIGYHYVIDEEGQIYEGRSGGDKVVGGHVYCGNVGTVGVVLMGNFEQEQPTLAQTSSLKWLLSDLADRYDLDLSSYVRYHGERLPVVVGHKDLISTVCPGYYVSETLGQLRRHLIAGQIDQRLIFPVLAKSTYTDRSSMRRALRIASNPSVRTVQNPLQKAFVPVGSTRLVGRPGGQVYIALQHHPGSYTSKNGSIADVRRSSSLIGIWQQVEREEKRVRSELLSPGAVREGSSQTVRLRVQLPDIADRYTIDIGGITYELKVEGRRIRSVSSSPARKSFSAESRRNVQTPGFRRSRMGDTRRPSRRTVTLRSRVSSRNPLIRIRLGHEGARAEVETSFLPKINGKRVGARLTELRRSGSQCVAFQNGIEIDRGIIRIDPSRGISTLRSADRQMNQYRGIIECQIVDSELTIINEVPMEDYLAGLAEEGDSEHFQKQRAFAIAARSYASHYLDPRYRKFPGKPYDGNDSPAHFQAYGGYVFEEWNPNWVRAVQDTTGQILMKDGDIIKAAYFSSDDGRTRSPAERGWNNYPHAEIFYSKPDPWCEGMILSAHGVGMSGCGAQAQATEGKTAEEILQYYYPETTIAY